MQLKDLIKCNYNIEITGIKTNSTQVKKGDLFICTQGKTMDRHLFIDDAIKNGASAIIVSKDISNKRVPIIKVNNTNDFFIEAINKFYDFPTKKLNMIGITGTDGKTTVATIIYTLLNNCAYIGTNGIFYNDYKEKTPNTTPGIDKTYPLFNDMIKNNIKTVSMEVSSEGILMERVKGIQFNASILTNITKEHLNTHKTLENYIDCKCELFRNTIGPCILNKDDEHYLKVKENCNGQVYTYGIGEDNDMQIKDVKLFANKTVFTIHYENKDYHISSPLLAMFNVYNLTAALLCLVKLNYKLDDLLLRIPSLKISGRLENINLGQNFKLIVDYAHTPNGIKNLLSFFKSLNHNKLIVVFSEPGERDKSKRAEKGYNVISMADYAIITSQDPRSEDPKDIASDLIENVKEYQNYEIIIDRSEAIKKAINMAKENDIILIIGKGSETYQIIKNDIIYFSDIDEAKKHLTELLKAK